jgi:hypothetical protein
MQKVAEGYSDGRVTVDDWMRKRAKLKSGVLPQIQQRN